MKVAGQELNPEFLIAPYFYLEPDNLSAGLKDNLDFIDKSKQSIDSFYPLFKNKLFSEIILNTEVLTDTIKRNQIIDTYKNCSADGFLIWIDDFSEASSSETALKTYKEFLIKLSDNAKPLISLHGSYLSIALSGADQKLLAGIGHGIEYGEHRPVIPVGGGVPLATFYFPKFHKRVDYSPDAEDILIEMN